MLQASHSAFLAAHPGLYPGLAIRSPPQLVPLRRKSRAGTGGCPAARVPEGHRSKSWRCEPHRRPWAFPAARPLLDDPEVGFLVIFPLEREVLIAAKRAAWRAPRPPRSSPWSPGTSTAAEMCPRSGGAGSGGLRLQHGKPRVPAQGRQAAE